MEKTARKQQPYFSSSNQDNDEQRPSKAQEGHNAKQGEQISQMSSSQLFQLFFDQGQYQQMLKKQGSQPQLFQKFIWRVHYLLGVTVLQVQNFLVQDQVINNCLLLQNSHVERIVEQIIDKAKLVPLGHDFIRIKTHIDQFCKHKDYDTRRLLSLYSEFVKLSRSALQFDMELSFTTLEQDLQKKNQFARTNMSAEINQQYSQPHKTQPLASLLPAKRAENSATRGYDVEKGSNRKWSPTEQAIFCKIYSETDSPVVCAQLMQKQAGPDTRWKTPNQIEDKMASLVAKVFHKFQSLSTNNEFIRVFRENKKTVFDCPQNIKKKIFRNIAIIYESMLNVSEQKKAVISQKILEVNRLCRDAAHMK